MCWPVILTQQAQHDLQEIVSFIASDSPERARRFGNELLEKALSIGKLPEVGRTVMEVGDPAVREIIHRSYRIVYEVLHELSTVYVLRFWHGARGTPDISNA